LLYHPLSTTARYTLSLHDALAISPTDVDVSDILAWPARTIKSKDKCASRIGRERKVYSVTAWVRRIKTRETDGDWHIEVTEEERSEEHTSELQSRFDLVCRLLLEK